MLELLEMSPVPTPHHSQNGTQNSLKQNRWGQQEKLDELSDALFSKDIEVAVVDWQGM